MSFPPADRPTGRAGDPRSSRGAVRSAPAGRPPLLDAAGGEEAPAIEARVDLLEGDGQVFGDQLDGVLLSRISLTGEVAEADALGDGVEVLRLMAQTSGLCTAGR